jgi:hypothetical protein
MNKSKLILWSSLAVVSALLACKTVPGSGTQRKVTTSQISRQRLTNETQGQIQPAIGISIPPLGAPPINVVRDFGAVGDGITPSQQAFQGAVNYAISNGVSDIYIPSVPYRHLRMSRRRLPGIRLRAQFTKREHNIKSTEQRLHFTLN